MNLNEKCVSSDSNLTIKKCWCAECKEIRSEHRQQTLNPIVALRLDVLEMLQADNTDGSLNGFIKQLGGKVRK